MLFRVPKVLVAGVAAVGLASAAPGVAPAQEKTVEVLARGPVHEAFATALEYQAGPVVAKVPPDAIEELPPDQKPEGDNVQWLPGYWHYDEERTDYIWISGFWRVPPPGRAWVPGSWREVRGGWQWVHGMWQVAQIQRQVEYLPAPPAPVEVAPSVPSPSEAHVYVPGSWVWRERYVWRPGVWVGHRPGWLWTPCHYRYTTAGYVFVDGYWDYPLAERGVLFAPVYVPVSLYSQPAYFYTPSYVVADPCLYTSLFTRRGWGCYYFGDYYEARYINTGYSAWCGSYRGSGFGISIGFGGGRPYDPLWDYYRIQNRNDRAWVGGINDVYAGRYNGTVARPPRTLIQQTTVINNITNNNVTIVNNNNSNNTTVNRAVNNVSNLTMVTNLSNVSQTNKQVVLKPVAPEQRTQEVKFARDLRDVSAQRKQQETSLADKVAGGPIPAQARTAPLVMTKAAVARAQLPETTSAAKAPPPAPVQLSKPPVTAAQTRPGFPPVTTTPGVPAPKPATPPVMTTPGEKPKAMNPPLPAPKPSTPLPAPKPPTPAAPPAAVPPAPKPPTPAPVIPAPKPVTPPATIPPPIPKLPPAPVPAPAPRPVIPAPAPAPRPLTPPVMAPPPAPRPTPPPVFVPPPAPRPATPPPAPAVPPKKDK